MQNQEDNNAPLEQLWTISEGYKDGYEPNVEKGLALLKGRIAKEKTTSTAKVIPMRRVWLTRIAASVLFLLASGFLFNLFVNNGAELQQLATTNQLMENVQLPDGSTVWLNKHSQLSFPKSFIGTARIVQLEGEAFFKVAKNAAQPFIVQMPNSTVKVLGTEFNVRAYSEEATTMVEVAEGSVAFTAAETQETRKLTANDKVILNKKDATLSVLKPLDWKDVAWKEKQLSFDSQPLKDVLTYLKTNFDVEVAFDKSELSDCPFTATIVDNTPKTILNQVALAFKSIELEQVDSKSYELKGSCE